MTSSVDFYAVNDIAVTLRDNEETRNTDYYFVS